MWWLEAVIPVSLLGDGRWRQEPGVSVSMEYTAVSRHPQPKQAKADT